MPLLAICRFLSDISCVFLISKSKNCAANENANKKSLTIPLKGFVKQSVIEQITSLSVFLFSLTAV